MKLAGNWYYYIDNKNIELLLPVKETFVLLIGNGIIQWVTQ